MYDIKTQIKMILLAKKISMKDFCGMLKTSEQNFGQKLNKGSLKYNDVLEIAKMLNYKIEWKEER